MSKRLKSLSTLIALILFALAISACGGAPEPEPTPTEAPPTKTPLPPPSAADEEAPAAVAPASGGMRTFTIVPGESSASYLVDEEFFEDAFAKLGIAAGEADVIGTTENVAGQITLNLDDLSAPLGETVITADLTTLATDQRRRDGWIQDNGPQFARYPQAVFRATSLAGLPAAYSDGEEVQFQLSGDLTVRDIAVPLVFDVTAAVNGDTLSGTAETRLTMSSFGFDPPNFARTLSVADEFGIRVNLVARE